MEWSAEIAALEMWEGLDLTETNGEVRAYFTRCLQDAFTAGVSQGMLSGRIRRHERFDLMPSEDAPS